MRQVTETINLYTYQGLISEIKKLTKIKENIKEELRNDNSYGDWILEERIKTLKKFAETLNGKLDYSVSLVPDRGEYIKIVPINDELNFKALDKIVASGKSCPFTGVCYDDDLIEGYKETKSITETLNRYLESIHNEYESIFEDSYLSEHCEGNDYEFTANGKLY